MIRRTQLLFRILTTSPSFTHGLWQVPTTKKMSLVYELLNPILHYIILCNYQLFLVIRWFRKGWLLSQHLYWISNLVCTRLWLSFNSITSFPTSNLSVAHLLLINQLATCFSRVCLVLVDLRRAHDPLPDPHRWSCPWDLSSQVVTLQMGFVYILSWEERPMFGAFVEGSGVSHTDSIVSSSP